ncbi:unnamed protein product [Calypogeia fissa]
MGNSFGCSATGERLVSAARDGDFEEAQALLECNPRLAKYSTFGVRNSPLHFSAMQGHNEIVTLLLECGVEVNTRNYCGQTALMQACRYGHWEVAQTLLLFKANVTRADYLNGRTALHFSARNGHARCIRLVVADYVPSVQYLWNTSRLGNVEDAPTMKTYMDRTALSRLVNKPADGGISALHMAALNGHTECVQLLLDLMANVSATTIQDGTTIDMIGAGSTALHYAACGGSIPCCQALISRGANRNMANCNGWIPLQVARLWRRHWLEPLLAPDSQLTIPSFPTSRYLALPLMSIVRIARDCGWRDTDPAPSGTDPCAVCLERRCTVAAQGCGHELCTRCALYLSTTMNVSSTVTNPPGSVPCPLCRRGIVAFEKLPTTMSLKELSRVNANMTLALCTTCTAEVCEPTVMGSLLSKVEFRGSRVSPVAPNSSRVTCPSFSALNLALNCSSSVEGSPEYDGPEQYVSARTSVRTESTEWTASGDGDSMIEESNLSTTVLGTDGLSTSTTPVHDESKAQQFACCRVPTKCGFPKVFYWRHYGGVSVPEQQY